MGYQYSYFSTTHKMQQNTILISIILPTYNRKKTIETILFPSLESQTYMNRELVVIDDCSSDDTQEYMNSQWLSKQFPNVASKLKYYKNIENVWSPLSRNRWFENATGDWIFMVEDDLQITDPLFLEKFIDYQLLLSKVDGSIGVICPKRVEYSKWYYKNFNHQLINYGVFSWEIYLDPDQSYSWYIPNAQACSFIKKEIVSSIKYDTKNYSYFREESDFYERVKRMWYRLYYVWDFLVTYHRMDLVISWWNRKHSVSISNEYKYRSSHYTFLSNYFSYPRIRIVAYVWLRLLKHIWTILRFPLIKNLLSLLSL